MAATRTTATHTAAATQTPALDPDPNWWRQAVVYQVYPRSFKDNNGDGLGDLAGVTSRVPYLQELGVDAVWLSPFYPSALADGGYDVDDYRDVDPRLGTLADFDAMVAALHAAGIRVIVDIVPNHSSNRHRWFREALAAASGDPARDRYIFRDGLGPDRAQPPTDWRAQFGGSAWEPVGDGQFYLHSFAPEQPDWNWDHPDVRREFDETLRFWADRGVDGFRIDVADSLVKDLSEPLPTQAQLDAWPLDGTHPLRDRDGVHAVYRHWRAIFDSYDPPRTAVAEAWVPVRQRRNLYAMPDELGQAFNFDLLEANFDAAQFHDIVDANLQMEAQTGSSATWVLSNHDVVRHASRYALPDRATDDQRRCGTDWLLSGGAEPVAQAARGLRRARAATGFILALPGSTYLYQGEELGLPEVPDLPDAARQDPTFFRSPGVDVGRDGCRVPLPWVSVSGARPSVSGARSGAAVEGEAAVSGEVSDAAVSASFGFSTDPAVATHLPQPSYFLDFAVSAQEADPDSTLSFYRRALQLRREFLGGQVSSQLSWLDTGAVQVLAFERPGGWICVTNFDAAPLSLPVDGGVFAHCTVCLSSQDPTWGGQAFDGSVPGETTLWLRRN